MQNSWGSELHKDLKVHPKGRVVYKGVNPAIDSYSAFFDNAKLGKTCLEELIRDEGCTDVYVCGIATDVCVGKEREAFKQRNFKNGALEPKNNKNRESMRKT